MGAVAKKKNAELSTDVMDDILEFAGEGATYDSSEMQIPFIRILQAMSPQLKKREAQYIEGSEQGDMFNNVTMELFTGEEGITVVPCFQTTKYLEFIPREQGGGFQGEIQPLIRCFKKPLAVGPRRSCLMDTSWLNRISISV
jgi:hypothetical protein